MKRTVHLFPTRLGTIELIREYGVKAMYGDRKMPPAPTLIAFLEQLTDSEYATRSGCDHHDEHGICLGHTDDDAHAEMQP